MSEKPFRFMDLPPELRVEILGYVLRQGERITLNDDRISTDGHRWKRELAALDGKRWKPAKADRSINTLRCGPDLRGDGVAMYWGGNDFVFSTYQQLQKFIQTCPEAPPYIKSMIVGEPPPVSKVGPGLSKGIWPVGGWPPSLEVLTHLTSLRSFDLFWGAMWGLLMTKKLGESCWGTGEVDMPHCLKTCDTTLMAAYYTRDNMLKSVPGSVLERLTSLTMRYRTVTAPEWDWTARDALQYAKKLQSGAWKVCPFETRDETGRWEPKDAESQQKALLWLEARAAVYWDSDLPIRLNPQERQWAQWCTWSREWNQYVEGGYHARPRAWEELFDEHGEVRGGVI